MVPAGVDSKGMGQCDSLNILPWIHRQIPQYWNFVLFYAVKTHRNDGFSALTFGNRALNALSERACMKCPPTLLTTPAIVPCKYIIHIQTWIFINFLNIYKHTTTSYKQVYANLSLIKFCGSLEKYARIQHMYNNKTS